MNFAAAFCYWCVFHIEKRGKKTDIETRAHDENEQEFYACLQTGTTFAKTGSVMLFLGFE